MELLRRGGAPIGEAGADGEAFAENGAEVGRELEAVGGFDGGEFGFGEAVGDRDAARSEMVDD